MSALGHIVVVGGGLAAARTCDWLRDGGHTGAITLVGAEAHAPYDRPPLSKGVLLGKRDDTDLGGDFGKLEVAFRPGVRATGLRVSERVLVTDAGEIPYDGAVLATGADPVRLPGDGEQLTLRTIDDALALRARLVPGARVVIIGASWIGAEVATAARVLACAVTCVEAGPVPLAQSLGKEVGKRLLGWWDGIDLRCGAAVKAVVDGGVELTDGTLLPADVVVTGVGVRPATAWLDGSGLTLDRGVVVDEWLRAAPGVVAVGDLAAWWSRRYGRRMRVEHWEDASDAAMVAAATLLHPGLNNGSIELAPHDPVPYFWSDQFGHKIQYVGLHDAADSVVWRQRAESFSAFWLGAGGELRAAMVVDLPREATMARMALMRGLVPAPDLLADPEIPLAKAGHAA